MTSATTHMSSSLDPSLTLLPTIVLCPFYIVAPKNAHSTQGKATPAQSRVGQSVYQASDTILDAHQNTVGPSGCQGTLLSHIQLVVNLKPQIPFCRVDIGLLVPQSLCIARVASSQVWNLAIVLVELNMTDDCPAL